MIEQDSNPGGPRRGVRPCRARPPSRLRAPTSAESTPSHRPAAGLARHLTATLLLLVIGLAPAAAATVSEQPDDERSGLAGTSAVRIDAPPDIARLPGGFEASLPLAQSSSAGTRRATRELYISWGYNADRFRRTDLQIAQPTLGNDFVLHDVQSHDDKGWTDLFHNSLTTSQYSARIGYFFTARQDLAIELSFEHVRFLVTQDQDVRMTGRLNGVGVDQSVALTEDFLRYRLNNGANFLLVNLVKRLPLVGQPAHRGSLSALLNGGAGVGFPHPTNFVFGQRNTPAFQFGGVDLGIEGALRFQLFRLLYVEFAQKGVYAHYSGLKVNEGRAAHDIWTYVTALSLGTSLHFPLRRRP